MTKFESILNQMYEENLELFKIFEDLHNDPNIDTSSFGFQKLGEQILGIINQYENLLCEKSDRSGKGKFTGSLSEKFWGKIREKYPLIDAVGMLPA